MAKKHIIAVVQARMGSSRLPGKTLLPLAGRPLIDYPLERLCLSLGRPGGIDEIVLASSSNPENDPLEAHVRSHWPQVRIIRGDEEDVLSRFIEAIHQTQATAVIRATGDCPLLNIDALHAMLAALEEQQADVINYEPGYEYADKGLEAVNAAALLRAAVDPVAGPRDREHVTSLFYREPERYRVGYIASEAAMKRGDLRLTVDDQKDLDFFEALFAALGQAPVEVPIREIVAFLDAHPEIAEINAFVGRKSTRNERARLGLYVSAGEQEAKNALALARLLTREMKLGIELVMKADSPHLSLFKKEGFAMERLAEGLDPEGTLKRLLAKVEESDWSGIALCPSAGEAADVQSWINACATASVPTLLLAAGESTVQPGLHVQPSALADGSLEKDAVVAAISHLIDPR